MNKLSLAKRAQIIGMLVEGNSLRATSRMADVAYNTVLKLLVEAGKAAHEYQDKALRNLPCKRVQVDEIWSFCYAKQKNIETIKKLVKAGNVWTWVAICEDTKLVPSWLVGDRDIWAAKAFITDLSERMKDRINLISDGYKAYPLAVEGTFAQSVDYAMLVKQYDKAGKYTGAEKKTVIGNPDKVSTCYVERQNLTMRMGIRRFTRKTNGFSKKIENHGYAVALHFLFYNYARIHKTLRVTPAMQAGISDHVWSLEEIAKLISKN